MRMKKQKVTMRRVTKSLFHTNLLKSNLIMQYHHRTENVSYSKKSMICILKQAVTSHFTLFGTQKTNSMCTAELTKRFQHDQ